MTRVPEVHRLASELLKMDMNYCPVCNQAVFPMREVCPHCHKPLRQVIEVRKLEHFQIADSRALEGGTQREFETARDIVAQAVMGTLAIAVE